MPVAAAARAVRDPAGFSGGATLAAVSRMSWQRRLVELIAAGGALASSAGCSDGGQGFPCGNASPDPCICDRTPLTSPQCVAEQACRDHGGEWAFYLLPATDAGSGAPQLEGQCIGYPRDAPPPVDALTVDAVDGALRD